MTILTTYEQLFNILAKSPGHIYWKDINGVYQGSNDAQAVFLGYKAGKDLIGKTDFDLPWKKQAIHLKKIDKQVMETQEEYSIEEAVSNYEGIEAIFLSRKIPLYEPHTKKVIGIIGISLDITATKQAEIAKQQFIMNMAHDLRTPLAGIIGIAGIQAEEGTHDQDKQHGRWISEASNQLLELLNAVLKVIATDQIGDTLKKEPIDLFRLIKELQALIQPAVSAKKLKFECITDATLPSIMGDSIKLKRILLNLLSNAIKFTKKGKISLEVNLLAINAKQATLALRVSDTGIGIAEDKWDKIFDRFYRAHPSYQSVYPGYGIGLFLVKKAVEQLDGSINVSSEEGKGSCFRLEFNFPLAEECTKEAVGKLIDQTSDVNKVKKIKETILVVEDNALVCHAIKNNLVNLGYEVITASEGEAALNQLKSHRFAWVLLDIGLPDIAGTEVARRYRQWEHENNKPHLPIFALTAHVENKVIKNYKKMGIDYILHKPFTKNDIKIIKKFIK